MANIVITKPEGKNYFKFVSNDVDTGWNNDRVWPEHIYDVHDNGVVYLHFDDGEEWELTVDGDDGSWQVDSVQGVIPENNEHLADLIADLKG